MVPLVVPKVAEVVVVLPLIVSEPLRLPKEEEVVDELSNPPMLFGVVPTPVRPLSEEPLAIPCIPLTPLTEVDDEDDDEEEEDVARVDGAVTVEGRSDTVLPPAMFVTPGMFIG